jgi:hypothetical protein
VDVLRPQVLEMSKLSVTADQTGAVFTVMIKRLCLMRDWQLLIQPVSNLYSEDGKLVLAANGEIYNQRVA